MKKNSKEHLLSAEAASDGYKKLVDSLHGEFAKT